MIRRHAFFSTVAAGGVVCLIATTVISCSKDEEATPTAPTAATVTTLTSMVVSASATSLTVGASATVSAVATYSDETSTEVTATWQSSAPGVATVSASGTVTAVALGITAITGTFDGQQDSVLITVAPPNADDILARCPTPSEVAVSDFDLNLVFESDPTAGQIVCTAEQSSRDLTLLEAQVYRVLTIMRQLEFDASLPWTSNSLYGWMVSSIDGMRFRSDAKNSSCCSNNMITIRATENLNALVYPTDFRWVGTLLVLFVHEARHNNGKPHTCGSSDNTIAELGAWGVQYYMNLFLGTHSDPALITPTMQSWFRQQAQSICSGRFCEDSCP